MSDTKIQWTDKTWNPVTGCTKVSAGCDHCYASTLHNQRFAANNLAGMQACGVLEPAGERHLRPYEGWQAYVKRVGPPPGQTWAQRARELGAKLPVAAPCYDTPFAVVQSHEDRLREPLSWRKPAKVFTCSMGDIFHEDVPDAFLDRIFAVMALTPHLTYQVLTKRPERARKYLQSDVGVPDAICDAINAIPISKKQAAEMEPIFWPLPNVWLGASVENQEQADIRIPDLLATPAAVRFLSCEPLLGPVSLRSWWLPQAKYLEWASAGGPDECPHGYAECVPCPTCPKIDWVIVGGESGPGARPMNLAWARSLRDQCAAAGVAFFMKQLGAKPYDSVCPTCGRDATCNPLCPSPELKLRDRHGGNWDEWPADLHVREFPGGPA